jgi:hypothetical protein
LRLQETWWVPACWVIPTVNDWIIRASTNTIRKKRRTKPSLFKLPLKNPVPSFISQFIDGGGCVDLRRSSVHSRESAIQVNLQHVCGWQSTFALPRPVAGPFWPFPIVSRSDQREWYPNYKRKYFNVFMPRECFFDLHTSPKLITVARW